MCKLCSSYVPYYHPQNRGCYITFLWTTVHKRYLNMFADLIKEHKESHGLDWFPNFSMHKKPSEGFIKTRFLCLVPRVSDSVSLGLDPIFCNFNQFPDAVDAARLDITH